MRPSVDFLRPADPAAYRDVRLRTGVPAPGEHGPARAPRPGTVVTAGGGRR